MDFLGFLGVLFLGEKRLSWSINVSHSLLLKSLLVMTETTAAIQKVLVFYG